MSQKSIPQFPEYGLARIEATVTITFMATGDEGFVDIAIDLMPHLHVMETLSMAQLALAQRIAQEITPSPKQGETCPVCASVLERRWSRDYAYSVQYCPECHTYPFLMGPLPGSQEGHSVGEPVTQPAAGSDGR